MFLITRIITKMNMHNPPHPSEFIKEIYLEPFDLPSSKLAQKLKISTPTFLRFMNAEINISPDMALRLSKVLGRSPESWLLMQDNYDLWKARQAINLDEFETLVFPVH